MPSKEPKSRRSVFGWLKRNESLNARRSILEDMFNDMYDDRRNIYLMNFFRGIFFGLGTAIGGSIMVALIIWMLSFFVDIPGGIGQAIQETQTKLENSQKH